jgi:hypothetical protein
MRGSIPAGYHYGPTLETTRQSDERVSVTTVQVP